MDLWSQFANYQNLHNQIQHKQLEQSAKHSKKTDQNKQVLWHHLQFILEIHQLNQLVFMVTGLMYYFGIHHVSFFISNILIVSLKFMAHQIIYYKLYRKI